MQHDGSVVAVATAQRPDPRDQFGEHEWLRQVIVRAGVQAFDSFIDFSSRGEQQDGCQDVARTQLTHDAQPVASGQHDVKDDHIECGRGRRRQSLVAMVQQVRRKALGLQGLADERRHLLFVFDNQHVASRQVHPRESPSRRMPPRL